MSYMQLNPEMQLASARYFQSSEAYARYCTASSYYKPLWILRAVWCLWQARRLSDKSARKGLKYMTAYELKIYAEILFAQKRYHMTLHVIATALSKRKVAFNIQIELWALLRQVHIAFFKKNNRAEHLERANWWNTRGAQSSPIWHPKCGHTYKIFLP